MTTQANIEKTLVPPTGLVVSNPSSAGGPPLFCLFTQDWVKLQTYIVQTLLYPITIGDFKTKYGEFQDEAAVTGCVTALQGVQKLSADFGNPMDLIKDLATNPKILETETAPQELYLHIVWFATKLYQTATTFNQTFGQFLELLNNTPPQDRQSVITEILTGDGGLQSSAVNMHKLSSDLSQAMAQFQVKLQPSIDTMSDYSGNSSKFYQDVADAINIDLSDVKSFQDAADTAYKLWRDLTISAITVSIGLSCLFPWSLILAPISAGVLGSEAQKARDAYDKARSQVNTANEDEQKKIKLKMDLDTFNKQMAPVNDAALNFVKTLEQVEGVWLNISTDLDYIAKNFTPDMFDNLPVFKEAMKLDDATQDWKTIAQKADEYTANSLVTYHIVEFGNDLPPTPAS